MSKLTGKDREFMKQIKFRRVDGKYFSHFYEKEDAYLYLKEMVNRYKFSGHKSNSIKDLCDEAQENGIMLYPAQLGRWIREVFGQKIKVAGRPYGERQARVNVSIQESTYEKVSGLSDNRIMGRFMDALIRSHIRLPVPDLFIILDDITIWMYMDGEEARAIHLNEITKHEHRMIQAFCDDAEHAGLEFVKERAERLGYKCLGVTEEE